jgi:hypothetical protein
MLGLYDNFPPTIHLTQTYTSSLPRRKLQQKITQIFAEINNKKYCFEEVGNPTVPNATVIFEFGIADAGNFNFLNPDEAQKLQAALEGEALDVMDWFCGIRYYKNTQNKKAPLKFDYYMVRMNFGEKGLEIVVFHERGPRYISPQDLVELIDRKVNQGTKKGILKRVES